MSEEQFWRSNPRIIKVWEEAWKNEQNRTNQLVHAYIGSYVMSAMTTSLAQILVPMFSKNKKSQLSYIEEPIQLFEKTEDEKKAEYDLMTQRFIAWGNSLIKNYKKPDN